MIIKRVFTEENTLEEIVKGLINSKIEEVIEGIESARYNEEDTIAPSQEREVH